MSETSHGTQHITGSALLLAFELGNAEWKLGFSLGLGQSPRRCTIDARNLGALQEEVCQAKKRFGLPEEAPVKTCYEAGRDGFWLHRYLVAQGIENVVVDSASIEVNRRAKRAKTDRLDVGKLLTMLARYHNGEKKVWSVVHVPSVEAEDQCHLHRQLLAFKADRTRHTNRMKGLLAGQGVRLLVDGDFLATLDQVRLWDGSPLPPGLRARLEREYACYLDMDRQIQAVEAERWEKIRTSEHPSDEQVRALLKLRGMGENSCPGRIIPSVTLHGDMMVSQATASGNRDAICPTQGER